MIMVREIITGAAWLACNAAMIIFLLSMWKAIKWN
jgi:hypothetical protein